MTQFRSPTQTSPAAEYLRTRVLSASPEELRLLLLEGAIKYITQGRAGLEKKDFEASYNGLSAGRNIVMELLTTIRPDPNPELAANVQALYTYMYKLLVEGGHEKDLSKLDTVIGLLEYERETWVLLIQKLAAERGVVAKIAPAPAERAPLSVQG
jgi:flagellar protein FliS